MAASTTPQEMLRVQKALVAIIWVAIALFVGFALFLLLQGSSMGWPVVAIMIGVIGMFATFTAAMLGPARLAASELEQHSVGDSGHHCQCFECGRTFRPHPSSPETKASQKATPQQRAEAARSATRAAPLAGLFLLLGILGAVILEYAGYGSGQNLVYGAIFVAVVSIAFIVVVLVINAQRRSAQLEVGRHPENHGCTCRWCGRTSGNVTQRAG